MVSAEARGTGWTSAGGAVREDTSSGRVPISTHSFVSARTFLAGASYVASNTLKRWLSGRRLPAYCVPLEGPAIALHPVDRIVAAGCMRTAPRAGPFQLRRVPP